jgi:hypothetical protein
MNTCNYKRVLTKVHGTLNRIAKIKRKTATRYYTRRFLERYTQHGGQISHIHKQDIQVNAPEEEEVFGVPHFVTEEEADGLDALVRPVHVVAQEEVVALGRVLAHLKQPEQVGELAVGIPAHVHGRVHLKRRRHLWLVG